jgi:tRNA(Ile)-lysidine synthetase-like protein
MVFDLVHAGATGVSLDLPRGLVVTRTHDRISFALKKGSDPFLLAAGGPETNQFDAFADRTLAIPGEAQWGGWTFRAEALDASQVAGDQGMAAFLGVLRATDPEGVEYLDYDRVGASTLTIRRRRPGDRITPLGSPGSRKLKDYFISRHVPRAERDMLPLVCAGDKIVVVATLGVDNDVALSAETKRVLKITATRTRHEGDR